MFREYALPSSGESLAFGDAGDSRTVDMWTSAAGGDDVEIRFIPQSLGAKSKDFADFVPSNFVNTTQHGTGGGRVPDAIPGERKVRGP